MPPVAHYVVLMAVLCTLPVVFISSCSKTAKAGRIDDLFFLSQEQGYCEAVTNYRFNPPAQCQRQAQLDRIARLDALKSEFNVQPGPLQRESNQ